MNRVAPHAVTKTGLTGRQRECLAFIQARIETTGISPSYDEILVEMGLRSKSGVSRLVDCLVERGHLIRLRNRARGLALIGGALDVATEAKLSLLASLTGRNRQQLVAQAVEEFLHRQVPA